MRPVLNVYDPPMQKKTNLGDATVELDSLLRVPTSQRDTALPDRDGHGHTLSRSWTAQTRIWGFRSSTYSA